MQEDFDDIFQESIPDADLRKLMQNMMNPRRKIRQKVLDAYKQYKGAQAAESVSKLLTEMLPLLPYAYNNKVRNFQFRDQLKSRQRQLTAIAKYINEQVRTFQEHL